MKPELIFKLRVTAIILIAVGYGWAGGHFIPSDSPAIAYLFQAVVIAILLVLALGFFSIPRPKWALRGLTIFAAISLVINVANIIKGASGAESSFGSHNTLADLVPIGILIVSEILWLTLTIYAAPKTEVKTETHNS